MSILGTRVVRTEDPRLLTAGGTYTDDLRLPELAGALRVTFVRSPVAHAEITGIDAKVALDSPGVVAVLTAADADDLPPAGDRPTTEPLLAADRVRYVGEPVAIVLTEDSYQGEDAAELVSVDYQPLEPVVGMDTALAGTSLLFPGAGSNVVGSGGQPAPDDAFAGCDVVVQRTFPNQRVAPVPLEVRAAAAHWAGGRLTLWASTQNAQQARDQVAGALGLEAPAVRVITPDVGGGFGAKIATDRDTLAVAWAARRLGRPVRWVETRNENLLSMVHGRAQQHTIRIGGSRDGRILAYHLDIVQDCGAYPRFGLFLPTLTQLMASGVYDLPYCGASYQVVVTNTMPISAYRGAGRPEATAAIERAVDLFAAEIGLDPVEVRRRNLVPPELFPYTTPGGAVYDTGEYAAALDKVLTAAGYPELRAEQARRRERVTWSSSASGCPVTWRSPRGTTPGARRPGWWWTAPGRPPCTPAARRTARAIRPRSPCWSPANSASRWTGSPCGTATPTRCPGASAPTAPGPCNSAAARCTRPRSRFASRRAGWPRVCWRPARPTWSWTSAAAPGRCAATRIPR